MKNHDSIFFHDVMGPGTGNQYYSPCKHVFYARKPKNDYCSNFSNHLQNSFGHRECSDDKYYSVVIQLVFANADITLTGYHPPTSPPPSTPELLHRNACPALGLLHNRSRRVGPGRTGAGLCINRLSNMKIVNTVISALKLSCLSA